MSTRQFRPYMSEQELAHTIALLESDNSQISHRLLAKLRVFQFKISNSLVKPASTVTPKLTMMEKLGGVSPEEQHYLSGCMTQEEEEKYLEKLMGGGDS